LFGSFTNFRWWDFTQSTVRCSLRKEQSFDLGSNDRGKVQPEVILLLNRYISVEKAGTVTSLRFLTRALWFPQDVHSLSSSKLFFRVTDSNKVDLDRKKAWGNPIVGDEVANRKFSTLSGDVTTVVEHIDRYFCFLWLHDTFSLALASLLRFLDHTHTDTL
jgi:hypothetical protein